MTPGRCRDRWTYSLRKPVRTSKRRLHRERTFSSYGEELQMGLEESEGKVLRHAVRSCHIGRFSFVECGVFHERTAFALVSKEMDREDWSTCASRPGNMGNKDDYTARQVKLIEEGFSAIPGWTGAASRLLDHRLPGLATSCLESENSHFMARKSQRGTIIVPCYHVGR